MLGSAAPALALTPTDTPVDVSGTPTPTPTPADPYLTVNKNSFAPRLGEVTTVAWQVSTTARVRIAIFNSAGEIVVRSFRDEMSDGGVPRSAVWDGRNDLGDYCASGVYIFRVFAPGLLQLYAVAVIN